MKKGKILAQGSREELGSYINENMLHINFSTNEEAKICEKLLSSGHNIKLATLKSKSLLIGLNTNSISFTEINKWLLDKNIKFNGIEIVEPSLEDIFLMITNSTENSMEVLKC